MKSRQIKRYAILGVVLLCFVLSCAKKRRVAGPPEPPAKKLIILPEKKKGAKLKPYVVNGQRYYPIPESKGFIQYGKASWYGEKFHGRRTANGEVFDMYRKSAAHKTLPLGTYVKVLNLSNSKEVVVRINDRGPFVEGRIIDLSYAAAREIGLVRPGVTDVKIVALGREVDKIKSAYGIKPVVEIRNLEEGTFTVQVGAYENKENAFRLAHRLEVVFDHVEMMPFEHRTKGTVYRVRVSRSKTMKKAREMEKRLKDMGFEGAFIVSL